MTPNAVCKGHFGTIGTNFSLSHFFTNIYSAVLLFAISDLSPCFLSLIKIRRREKYRERERDKKEREFKRKARGVYVKTPSSSALSLSLSLSGFHIPKTRSFHISFAKMISLNRSSFLVILTKPISQIILSSTPTSPKKKKKKKKFHHFLCFSLSCLFTLKPKKILKPFLISSWCSFGFLFWALVLLALSIENSQIVFYFYFFHL
jgi:hypothetical protein